MKNFKSLFLLAAMILVVSQTSFAQKKNKSTDEFAISAGIEAATIGAGVNVAARVTPFLTIKGGYTFIPKISADFDADFNIENASQLQTIIDNNADIKQQLIAAEVPTNVNSLTQDAKITGEIKLGNAKLLAEFYPIKKSSFHITVGAYMGSDKLLTTKGGLPENAVKAYDIIVENQGTYGYTAPQDVEFGNASFNYKELKNVEAYAKVNNFKPYFGIGIGRSVPKGRVSFSLDLGAAYLGDTKVEGNTEKLTTAINNDMEANDNDKYLDYAKFYPVLSFNLNVKLFSSKR